MVSAAIAYIIHVLVVPLNWQYGWLIDAPSVVGVYGLLRTWFVRRLWRMQWTRKVGIVTIPNLAGKWEGHFTSSYDSSKRHCIAEICQDWLTMSVIFEAGESSSVSVMAGLTLSNASGPQLNYCYVNRANFDKQLFDHDGTQWLIYKKVNDEEFLEGDYYTSRKDGQTRGHVILRRAAH